MKFWGITGGIGSGKSQVLSLLEKRGYPVLDADIVSRQVVDPAHPTGLKTLQEIAQLAGPQILQSNGTLNRVLLREWMSKSDENRVALEEVIRPSIRTEILKWMDVERQAARAKAGFIEASRMIESGLSSQLDGVLWVSAPRDQRLVRASNRDGRSVDEIAALADLQLSDKEFAAHATEGVVNAGSFADLETTVERFLKKAALLLAVLSLGVPQAHAEDSMEWFPSARSRSMGLALTAIVDDHDGLHTNPAGLALTEKRAMRLPDIFMGSISSSFGGLFKKFRTLDGSGEDSIAQQLQKFDGTAAGAEFSLLSAYWNKPRVGIAVNPVGFTASTRVRTPSLLFAKVNLYAAAQGGVTIGYAHPVMENHLRIGVALKPFAYRIGVRTLLENQDITNAGSKFSEFSGGGWGVDADVGVQGNLDSIDVGGGAGVKLMAGVAFQNLVENKFTLPLVGSFDGEAPVSERRINIGVAARLENPGVLEPTLSVEIRDLLTSSPDEFLEYFHAGFELLMRPRDFYTSAVRLGLAKGNLSGGIAFKWQIFELEIGSYAVNLGPGPGIGRDRRYFVQTALEF